MRIGKNIFWTFTRFQKALANSYSSNCLVYNHLLIRFHLSVRLYQIHNHHYIKDYFCKSLRNSQNTQPNHLVVGQYVLLATLNVCKNIKFYWICHHSYCLQQENYEDDHKEKVGLHSHEIKESVACFDEVHKFYV